MSHRPGLWETRLASITGGAALLCPNQPRKQALLLFLSAQLLLPVLGGRDVRVSGTLSLWLGLASTPWRTVMQEEPLDPTLEILDDENAW